MNEWIISSCVKWCNQLIFINTYSFLHTMQWMTICHSVKLALKFIETSKHYQCMMIFGWVNFDIRILQYTKNEKSKTGTKTENCNWNFKNFTDRNWYKQKVKLVLNTQKNHRFRQRSEKYDGFDEKSGKVKLLQNMSHLYYIFGIFGRNWSNWQSLTAGFASHRRYLIECDIDSMILPFQTVKTGLKLQKLALISY